MARGLDDAAANATPAASVVKRAIVTSTWTARRRSGLLGAPWLEQHRMSSRIVDNYHNNPCVVDCLAVQVTINAGLMPLRSGSIASVSCAMRLSRTA
jgi:hypothetical protein